MKIYDSSFEFCMSVSRLLNLLTNLSNEYLGCVRVAGILKQISYEIQVSYVCK